MLLRTIERVRRSFNPELQMHGIVLTMFDRRNNLSEQVASDVRSFMGDRVYETMIPRNVRVSEAPSHGKPVLLYDFECVGAQAYAHLAGEMLRRERRLRRGVTAERRAAAPRAAWAWACRRCWVTGADGVRQRRAAAGAARACRSSCCARRRFSRGGISTRPSSRRWPHSIREQRRPAAAAGPAAPSSAAGYEIVAGERRWRAAQRAGLHEVPAVVRELVGSRGARAGADREPAAHRPVGAREAQRIGGWSTSSATPRRSSATAIGKSRSHIANTLRLLALPASVQAMIDEGSLSAGHARALIGCADALRLAQIVIERGLNVREPRLWCDRRRLGRGRAAPGQPGCRSAREGASGAADLEPWARGRHPAPRVQVGC